jgi:hypothetical protein
VTASSCSCEGPWSMASAAAAQARGAGLLREESGNGFATVVARRIVRSAPCAGLCARAPARVTGHAGVACVFVAAVACGVWGRTGTTGGEDNVLQPMRTCLHRSCPHACQPLGLTAHVPYCNADVSPPLRPTQCALLRSQLAQTPPLRLPRPLATGSLGCGRASRACAIR